MVHRLRFGEKVAGLSAVALFGFLFLDWFGASGVAVTPLLGHNGMVRLYAPVKLGGSGWDTLGWLALALCLVAIVAGLAVVFVFAAYESPVLPVLFGMLAMLLGGLAVIALIVQVIWQPGPDRLVSVESGWWLGLLAAAGIARGGFLSIRDEYLPGVPLPDVPVRPAPVA